MTPKKGLILPNGRTRNNDFITVGNIGIVGINSAFYRNNKTARNAR